jgi:SnoaL-like domain
MLDVALNPHEVRQFIDEWFLKLDTHAPVDEVLPLVADKELVMQLPETTVRGHEEFKQWYSSVAAKFFDEVHSIKALRITSQEQTARVEMVLLWECSTWNPPNAKSKRSSYYAVQTWKLERSPDTHKPTIATYNVDYFIPMPGSDEL